MAPRATDESFLTLGGYQKYGGDIYNPNRSHFTAHRIAGSFHWQVKANRFRFMGSPVSPSARVALVDTGTTNTVMPKQDWRSLFDLVCRRLTSIYSLTCSEQGELMTLNRPGIAQIDFPPISLQIDNVLYETPFDRWFYALGSDMLILNSYSLDETKFILGANILNLYY